MKLAVTGHPISHSMSPQLYRYWAKLHRLPQPFFVRIQPQSWKAFAPLVRHYGFDACHVTLPYKKKAYISFGAAHEDASLSRAVNFLLCRPDSIEGYNYDVAACREVFTEHLQGKRRLAVVFGKGGVAMAASLALAQCGVKEVIHIIRTQQKEENIPKPSWKGVEFHSIDKIKKNAANILDFRDAVAVINATPLGLQRGSVWPYSFLADPDKTLLLDVNYTHKRSSFFSCVKENTYKEKNGSDLFIHQAAHAFRRLYGFFPCREKALAYIAGLQK